MKKLVIKKPTIKQSIQNILTRIGFTMILSGIFFTLFLIALLILRVELVMECGDPIELDDLLKRLQVSKNKFNILLSALQGDDFGVGNYDTVSDAGQKLSTDNIDWGFTFDRQFGKYHSSDRSRDAKEFANICDYLYKVHDVKFLNQSTINTIFPENNSARLWFSDYDNSWGKKANDTYKNTLEFREHLRKIKWYKN